MNQTATPLHFSFIFLNLMTLSGTFMEPTQQEIDRLNAWDNSPDEDERRAFDQLYSDSQQIMLSFERNFKNRGYQWMDNKKHIAYVIFAGASSLGYEPDDIWLLFKYHFMPNEQLDNIFEKHAQWISTICSQDIDECQDQDVAAYLQRWNHKSERKKEKYYKQWYEIAYSDPDDEDFLA